MRERVGRTIARHALLQPGEALWVAVSGGVDSMVLLHVLRSLGHPVQVVHVDHGLRGPESDADRALVRDHCAQHGIPFHVEAVDVRAAMERMGGSVQMAARVERYAVFERLMNSGPHKLAMAHHADDVVETALMNLLQGMGQHGWKSIPVKRAGFIRPLIDQDRAAIERYAAEHGIPFRTDASNTDPKYLRSRVRSTLLPMLEELRPGVREVLHRNMRLARELDVLAQQRSAELLRSVRTDEDGVRHLPAELLLKSGAPHALLLTLLEGEGFHPDRIEAMVTALEDGRVGSSFFGNDVLVHVDRSELVLAPLPTESPSWTINDLAHPPHGLPMAIDHVDASDIGVGLVPTNVVAWFDASAIALPLELRPWRQGDRMQPAGMAGTKLISDVLIDAKVPLYRKHRVYVLADRERILWCCGLRMADGTKADPATGRVVRFIWQG
jgi:tRNA(Ile)-lysidine synthase